MRSFLCTSAFLFVLIKLLRKLYYYSKRENVSGKVVLITGASSGIGKALALSFASQGAKLILAARNISNLEKVSKEIQGAFTCTAPCCVYLDVEDFTSVDTFAKEALNCFGRVDILINNAGITARGPVENTSIDVYKRVMAINFLGPFALIKAFLPSLREHCGQVVVISSIQGLLAVPYRGAYSSSKHAITALHDSLRAEMAAEGGKVNVCVVSPGYVNTNLGFNGLDISGSKLGVEDKVLKAGIPCNVAADKIMQAVRERRSEFIVSGWTPLLAVYLKRFSTDLYYYVMGLYAAKQLKKD